MLQTVQDAGQRHRQAGCRGMRTMDSVMSEARRLRLIQLKGPPLLPPSRPPSFRSRALLGVYTCVARLTHSDGAEVGMRRLTG